LDPTDSTGKRCIDIDECASTTLINGGCAQQCHNLPGKYFCTCDTGYTLNSNGRGCYDINECYSGNGGCQQKCTNAVGSYTCSCTTPNVTLLPDGHTCIVPAASEGDLSVTETAGPVVAGVVVAVLLVGLLVLVAARRRDANMDRPVVEVMAVNPEFDFNEAMEYVPETDMAGPQDEGSFGGDVDDDVGDDDMAPGTTTWDVAHPDWVEINEPSLERHGDFKTVDFSTTTRPSVWAVPSAWAPAP